MHFGTKSYLKCTRNHTAKHVLNESSMVDYKLQTSGSLEASKPKGRMFNSIFK